MGVKRQPLYYGPAHLDLDAIWPVSRSSPSGADRSIRTWYEAGAMKAARNARFCRALEWLANRATRQTIKDQIDWLKNQLEKRRVLRGRSR